MTGNINFTAKQVEIMRVIKNKRIDGEFCDVYDIMDALSYDVKRDALLHSIKVLVDNGYVERLPRIKRGTRSVRPFGITSTGYVAVK